MTRVPPRRGAAARGPGALGRDWGSEWLMAPVKLPLPLLGLLSGLLATLLALAGCGGAPGAPAGGAAPQGGLSAQPGDEQVTLTWPSVPGAESYNLYWQLAPGISPESANRVIGVRAPYVHAGLRNGLSYYYLLTAVKGGRESALSAVVSAIPSAGKRAVLTPEKPVLRFDEFVAVLVRPGDTPASLAQKYLGDPGKDWVIRDFNGVAHPKPGIELIIPLKPFDRGGLTPTRIRSIPILTYHEISKTESNVLTVTEKAFKQQMKFLHDRGYRPVTLDQFYDFVAFKGALPEKAVVLTFDDGWRSTYELGLPVLKKYGFPAALFVYTDFIGRGEKALTWDMIAKLQANGVDIQCHSKSHRDLTRMNEDEQLETFYKALELELSRPIQVLQDKLKRRCHYLAYPFGATNRLVSALAQKHGYRLAFTANRGSATFFEDPYRIDRSMIFGTFNLAKFEQNLAQHRSDELQ